MELIWDLAWERGEDKKKTKLERFIFSMELQICKVNL